MNITLRNYVILILMLIATSMAFALRPTILIAERETKINLEKIIPHNFGNWHEEEQSTMQILDPGQQETIRKIYSQILSRTYINTAGERIMLSISYGENQSEGAQLHYPDVCYPAQGFQIVSKRKDLLKLPWGELPIKQLESILGQQRFEPITYWVMIGTTPVIDGKTKKIAEIKYAFNDEIPDGLLFRVSSLDRDSQRAFMIQKKFVSELLNEIPSPLRKRFAGN